MPSYDDTIDYSLCCARLGLPDTVRQTAVVGPGGPWEIRAFNHWDWKQEFVANHRAACLGRGGSSEATGLAASGPAPPKEPLQAGGGGREGKEDEIWRREERRQLSSPATGTDSSRYTSDCDREQRHRLQSACICADRPRDPFGLRCNLPTSSDPSAGRTDEWPGLPQLPRGHVWKPLSAEPTPPTLNQQAPRHK